MLSQVIWNPLWTGPREAVLQLDGFSGTPGDYSTAAASLSCLNTDDALEMRNKRMPDP